MDSCPQSITVSTSCFLATDFNTGIIAISLNYTLRKSHITSSLHHLTINWLSWSQSQSQSQRHSYFTTGGLQPISSSWCQATWDSWPETFLQLNPCGQSPYVTSSDKKMGLSLMNMLGLPSGIRIALITCYWKFFLLHYTQVLCQYRLCKADHAYWLLTD
jgi:hypothetical protein